MALGYHLFSPLDIPTATQMNGLVRQGTMIFASTAARDSALSGVLEEGMQTYQTDTNTITYYTGSAWRIIFQPSTSYTPTGSGAITTGNGTYTAAYSRSGDSVTVRGQFVLGSTSAIGSGQATLSLPVTADTSAQTLGSALFFDQSANNVYPAVVLINSGVGSSSMVVGNMNGAGGTTAVSSSVPFTWATSDAIYFTTTYLAA